MAKFIGSDLQSDNWGEDYLIKKMIFLLHQTLFKSL